MKYWKLTTKWFTFEFGTSTKLLFFIACLLVTGGTAILSANIWIYMAQKVTSNNSNACNCNSEIIGLCLIGLGLLLVAVTIFSWRTEIYYNLHKKLQEPLIGLFSFYNYAEAGAAVQEMKKIKEDSYSAYRDALSYINEHKILIDKVIEKSGREIVSECVDQITMADTYLKEIEKIRNRERTDFDAYEAFKYSVRELHATHNKFVSLESILRKKMVWKFSH